MFPDRNEDKIQIVGEEFKKHILRHGQDYINRPDIKLVTAADVVAAQAKMAELEVSLSEEDYARLFPNASKGTIYHASYIADIQSNDDDVCIKLETTHPIEEGMVILRLPLFPGSDEFNEWVQPLEQAQKKYGCDEDNLSEDEWTQFTKVVPTHAMFIDKLMISKLRRAHTLAGVTQPEDITKANIVTSWGSDESISIGGLIVSDEHGIYGIAPSAAINYFCNEEPSSPRPR